jgi:hypothetical protein
VEQTFFQNICERTPMKLQIYAHSFSFPKSYQFSKLNKF